MISRLIPLLALTSLLAGPAPGARGDVPPGWSPALTSAFEAYEQGRFSDAAALASGLVSSPDDRVSLDAEALASMCTIRGEGRAEQVDGRGRIQRLIRGVPALGDRPDLRLALGLGHLALNETSAALESLAIAAEGFEKQNRPGPRAEALAALAEAWSTHNEWSMTPAAFNEPTPTGVDAANGVRERRIRELRATIAGLPDSEAAIAQADLALGSLLLRVGGRTDEAIATLRRVAGMAPVDRTVARANLLLADEFVSAGQTADAAALYERVARADAGDLTLAAERRLRSLREPGFEVEVPRRAATDTPVIVDVHARNVVSGSVELRRFSLAGWLETQRGQFVDAALPEEGSVAASAAIVLSEGGAVRGASTRIEAPLDAGSYVIIARGRDAAGREVVAKRPLIVESLDASVIAGNQQGLILLGDGSNAQARFWMYGTYSPLTIEIADGVGFFVMPPEARLLRDRRWTCVITRGDALAVCRGSIGGDIERDALPRGLLLSLSPAAPRVGEEIVIAGLIAPPLTSGVRPPTRSLDVSLVDAAERVVSSAAAVIDTRGAFLTRIRATPEMAGKTLQTIVRMSGQTLDQLYQRASVAVEPLDPPTVRASVQMPPHISRLMGPVPVRLRTEWVGGGPLGGEPIELRTLAARWPSGDVAQVTARPNSRRESMPIDGRRELATNVGALNLPEGPKSVQLRLTAFCPDARVAVAAAPLLIAPDPLHGWIGVDSERPTMGVSTHLTVGWFDAARVVEGPPRLELVRPDDSRLALGLFESPAGLRSAEWVPSQAGRHRATLTLVTSGGGEQVFTRDIMVAPSPDKTAETGVSLRAERAGSESEPRVRIRLSSPAQQSVFVYTLAAEPIAAARVELAGGGDARTIELSAPGSAGQRLRVYAVRFEDHGPRLLAAADVAAAPTETLTLTETSGETILGGVKNFSVALPGSSLRGATIIARLVDARSDGRYVWQPGDTAPDRSGGVARLSGFAATLSGGDFEGVGAFDAGAVEPFDPGTVSMLTHGASTWGDAVTVLADDCTVGPAIPARQGVFRLEVCARLADGSTAHGSRIIDTLRSTEVAIEIPPVLEIGDRIIGVVRIEHRSDDGGTATLRLKLPSALRATRAEAGDGSELPIVDDAMRLSLAPRSTTHLRVEFEARAATRALLRAELESPDGRVPTAAPFRIADADRDGAPGDADGIVRIQRRIYRLERPAEWSVMDADSIQPETEVDRMPEYNRIPIVPDDPVSPGTPILVEETVELPGLGGMLDWQQRIPANCVTLNDAPRDFGVIGRLEERRTGSLRYSAPASEATRRVHNYIIVPTRSGVCRFPAPSVRLGRNRVAVEVEPETPLLNVGGQKKAAATPP